MNWMVPKHLPVHSGPRTCDLGSTEAIEHLTSDPELSAPTLGVITPLTMIALSWAPTFLSPLQLYHFAFYATL